MNSHTKIIHYSVVVLYIIGHHIILVHVFPDVGWNGEIVLRLGHQSIICAPSKHGIYRILHFLQNKFHITYIIFAAKLCY